MSPTPEDLTAARELFKEVTGTSAAPHWDLAHMSDHLWGVAQDWSTPPRKASRALNLMVLLDQVLNACFAYHGRRPGHDSH